MLRRASRLFHRFLSLSPADRVFLFRAAVELWRVRRRLRSSGVRDFRQLGPVPAGMIPETWGTAGDELPFEMKTTSSRVSSPSEPDQNTAAAVRRAARLVQASRHLLPGRCTCLELALALQRMLAAQRIPSDVRIGVRTNGDEFEAHAWLESFGTVVIGGDDVYQRYAVMPPLGLDSAGARHA